MNQNKQLWLVIMLLVAVLVGGVLGTAFSAVRSAQARQTEAQRKEAWDYCAIVSVEYGTNSFGRSDTKVRVRYFDPNGSREEIIEAQLPTSDYRRFKIEREAVSRAMAKLGNYGWEMVGRESNKNDDNPDFIYFKRLKQ
jgi:hypothetical protein